MSPTGTSKTADASDATLEKMKVTTPHPFARLQNPSLWEVARMVLGILSGLVPLRIFVLVASIIVGGSLTVVLHHMGLRSLCVYNLRFACRWLLLVSGYFWIPINNSHNNGKNRVFERGRCPKIIVSNHVSNMEILHMLTLPFQDSSGNPVLPVFVTKESIFGLPVIGTITRDVLGSIGVARKQKFTNKNKNEKEKQNLQQQQQQRQHSSDSISKSCTEQILERVHNGGKNENDAIDVGYGPIVIFPEGTTTNGTCLLDFKKGAFVPLVPVVPVLYSFGAHACDPKQSAFLPTYESIWGPAYLWRLLCQPVNRFQCTFMDTIAAPEDSATFNGSYNDKNDDMPSIFAEKVRYSMALEGDLPMLSQEYNYGHKLKYHNGLRKVFVEHPRGAKYAMCFEPMQKVFPDCDGAKIDETEASVGYDVVIGEKIRIVEPAGDLPAHNNDSEKKKNS